MPQAAALSALALDEFNPDQRKLADEIMKFSRVGISGPYNILMRSPVLLRRMLDLWTTCAGTRRCR